MKQCPACKKAYDDNTMFCKECGVALGNVINSVQMAPGAAYVTPAPAANAVPMNEHKEWQFKANWGGPGGSYKITNIVAEGAMMAIEQYKQCIFKFGKQQTTIDAHDVTDVHIKKNIQFTSVLCVIMGLMCLSASATFAGIVFIIYGILFIKNKYYVIAHRRGTVTVPLFDPDSSEGKDFLNYITKYSPYAVKTELSLGR